MIRTALAFAVGATLGASAATATTGDAMYTKPGQLLRATDGARLNFYCTGQGSPTVACIACRIA